MRLLVFIQGEKVEDQIGYHSGFETLQAEGVLTAYKAIPWRGQVASLGWQGFSKSALNDAADFCPDAVLFQFFHVPDSISLQYLLTGIQKLPSKPIIAISGGDAFGWHRWMKHVYPSGFLSVAKIADVTFVTAMGKCSAFLERRGVRNIMLLPLGVCQVRFQPPPSPIPSKETDFDVVFAGRFSKCRDPRSFLFYYARKRLKLVKILQKRYGKRFGLFGAAWNGQPSWQGEVSYAAQLDVCKRSQVIFGGSPGIYQDYYASDRPFIQGTSGVPFVDWRVPRINNLLRENDHWYLAHDAKSMIRQIDVILAQDPSERFARAHQTAHYVSDKFSQLAMMRFLVTTLQDGRSSQASGKAATIPKIPFFLPEINLGNEEQFATRNWATKYSRR